GPSRTRKTFLYHYLSLFYRLQGKVVIYIMSSSITALLLDSSYTSYSRFKIPIKLFNYSSYMVYKNT
ncbi:hypothetical protein L209DRAFT_694526, partial [Thermothelomyces heterothallicus CBS 203.75]